MKTVLVLAVIIVASALSFILGVSYSSRPFYITTEQIGDSLPKLSELHLTSDSTSRDSVLHGGQLFTPTIFYRVYKVDPLKYESTKSKIKLY